jgi:hypothetical protein
MAVALVTLPVVTLLALRLFATLLALSRRVALEVAHGQLNAQQPFDLLEQRPLVARDERDREAVVARAPGPADAVDLMLGHFR